MTRRVWPMIASLSLVFFLSTSAWASPFGDLNCDDSVNVTDVQLSIIVALGLPISDVLDADLDGTPDACPAEGSCGAGTVLDGGACVAVVTQADVDAAVTAAFDDGAASVDITTDNEAAFNDGVASVTVPGGETYCDVESTDWDEGLGACVSSVEEELNCWAAGFCHESNVIFGTGLENAAYGPASYEECAATQMGKSNWTKGTQMWVFLSWQIPLLTPDICV